MKAHILIVEDEAMLYDRLCKYLVKEKYSVDDYTPSVEEALARINKKRPDIVLLDINLEGEATGLDLGKILYKKYHIPFIYVTEFDDDQTFYQGLETNHEHFVVKTKPRLDLKLLIRTIQTILKKAQIPKSNILKDSILAYTDLVANTREFGSEDVAQVPISLSNILFFTTNTAECDHPENAKKKMKLKTNYARLKVKDGSSYYIPNNLTPIYKLLPYYFVRISEDYIININHEMLDGRINGKRLKINNQIFTISDTYKSEFEKRLDIFYLKMS